MAEKNEDYGLEDMVFVQEEEVFPIVDAHDPPAKIEVKEVAETVEEKPNGKRKLTEEPDDKKDKEKKVTPLLHSCIFTLFFYSYIQY